MTSNSASPTDSLAALDVVAAALRSVLEDAGAPDVASAYLFGSAAEGRSHRESDLDIGVLLNWSSLPQRSDRFEAGIRLAGRLQALLAQPVDLVVLNDVPPLFGRHVVTEGRRLLLRDARCDHDFVRDVQLRAADLAPWLARMRALKLASLRR
jgi:predicted nucleotidyltransferase